MTDFSFAKAKGEFDNLNTIMVDAFSVFSSAPEIFYLEK